MKLITLILTFILSSQLVYANATVCANFMTCGQSSVSSTKDQMKDCPFHASKKSEKKESKEKKQSQCKCCAILSLETSFKSSPVVVSALSFIEFNYFARSIHRNFTVFLRPPIS
jgi:hypothetical protein